MRMPLFAWLAVPLSLLSAIGRADSNPEIVPLGHDTYSLTRWAENGFARNTGKLKAQALEDAAAYCAKMHKEPKIISATTAKPLVPLTGFANARIVFKALDANDPELAARSAPQAAPVTQAPLPAASPVPRTETEVLYSDLMKLDELRNRGLLTEEEFQAKRKKLLEKSN